MTKEKLVPMTTEEEDKNADVVRDSNGNVMPEKLLKDDRGDLDLTKIIDLYWVPISFPTTTLFF